MINIKLDFSEGLRGLKATEQAIQKAATSTLNKLADRSKTAGVKIITETYNIKRKDLVSTSTGKARIKIYKASQTSQAAVMEVKGRPISLAYFGAKQTGGKKIVTVKGTRTLKRAGSKFAGVTVEIIKGQKTQLAAAFLAKTRSGHTGVFQRTSKSRLPVDNKAMVTVASLFGGKKVLPAIEERINSEGVQVFRHELEYFIGRGL